jgi:hypothetical protein
VQGEELSWAVLGPRAMAKAKAVPPHTMKVLGGKGAQLVLILDLGARWGRVWSASRPGRALAWGKDPRYPLHKRLGGPQSRSGQRLEEKSFRLCRGSNLDRPVVQSIVRHYTDSATPTPRATTDFERTIECSLIPKQLGIFGSPS